MTEVTTEYCKVCGHLKEHHDLDVRINPKEDPREARKRAERGQGACHDMSFDDHNCICLEFKSWF